MRLICPNCDAQYEVSDDAIPPGGRDVQCSNCQLSWFQTEKPTVPGRDTSTSVTPPKPVEIPDEALPEASDIDATEPEADQADQPIEEAKPGPVAAPQRKQLDDAVANILREEASRGGPAAAMAGAIAKPPATEAPRAAVPVSENATRERIALMTEEEGGTRTGAPSAETVQETADKAHLRTMPSINEINATLRARAQANDTSGLTEVEKEEAVQRGGFRRGFFLILLLFAILILPYIFADQIIENLPQTTDIMTSYVMTVDGLRLSLSEFVNGLTAE